MDGEGSEDEATKSCIHIEQHVSGSVAKFLDALNMALAVTNGAQYVSRQEHCSKYGGKGCRQRNLAVPFSEETTNASTDHDFPRGEFVG